MKTDYYDDEIICGTPICQCGLTMICLDGVEFRCSNCDREDEELIKNVKFASEIVFKEDIKLMKELSKK